MSPRRNWDSPNPSLASECVPSPPKPKGRGHNSPAGEGLGESQLQRLEKSLALCLLCAYIRRHCCVESLKAKIDAMFKRRKDDMFVWNKLCFFVRWPFLVVGVESGWVGRLPEHQQRRLVTEPDDEPARRVRRRREIRWNVRLKKRWYIKPVLRINDILVWIRTRGSMPLKVFESIFTSFFKDKKSRRSQKTVEIKVFLTIFV